MRSRVAAIAGALVALCIAAPTLVAQPAPGVAAPPPSIGTPSREQIQRRLLSVATLIGSSSGARQIDASRDADAASLQASARDLHAKAQAAFDRGDYAQADKLLDAAARAMFEGVRHAAPEQIVADKRRIDFDARYESTRALLEAQRRIAKEKRAGAAATAIEAKVEALLAQARSAADTGDYAAARLPLDQAYFVAKAAIGELRGGDTLVRTLTFASKEEEYRYEIDRNDTHRMLLQLVTKGEPSADASIRQAVADAERLRRDAEQQAATRDFDRGVQTLEESTRHLVRAIRAAGIYIPG